MSALFDNARNRFLVDPSLDWDDPGKTFKLALVRSYTFNAAHQTVADLTGAGGVIHTEQTIAGRASVGAGIADANDVSFPSVAANASNHFLLLYEELGTPAQDQLIAWIDAGVGLPIVPNGNNVNVLWENIGNRIFKL